MISCPQCGKLNPENFNYCLDCGAELHPEETHSAESQFFLDLSAQSPDVKKAREDAGVTPAPEAPAIVVEQAAPKVENAPRPIEKEDPRAVSSIPGEQPLELSPDDLGDELDEDIDAPLAIKPNMDDDGPIVAGVDSDVDFDVQIDDADGIEDEQEIVTDDDLFADEFAGDSQLELSDDAEDDIDLMQDVGPVVEEAPEPVAAYTPPPATSVATDPAFNLEPDDMDGDEAVDLDQDESMEVDVSQSEDIRCIKCNAELKAGDKFCWQCGTPTAKPAEQASGQTMFMHVGTSDSMEAAVVGKLVILEPSGREGRSFSLTEGENLCGRTSDPVLLDDKFVSPTHCAFVYENERMHVRDTKSVNGVYLKVKGEMVVKSGTMFRIGQQLMQFLAPEEFEIDPQATSPDDTLYLGSPKSGIWGKLVHITRDGRVLGQYAMRDKSLVIGRETGDIIFPQDGFTSGTHARLALCDDGACIIMDLGSSNGTFVQIKEHTLNDKDMVLIGKKLMRFEYIA